jgi:protein-tyrosine-phosphatase
MYRELGSQPDGGGVRAALRRRYSGTAQCRPRAARRELFSMVEDIQRWPFDNPAAVTGSDEEKLAKFREVRDQIDARVRAWIEEVASAREER